MNRSGIHNRLENKHDQQTQHSPTDNSLGSPAIQRQSPTRQEFAELTRNLLHPPYEDEDDQHAGKDTSKKGFEDLAKSLPLNPLEPRKYNPPQPLPSRGGRSSNRRSGKDSSTRDPGTVESNALESLDCLKARMAPGQHGSGHRPESLAPQ